MWRGIISLPVALLALMAPAHGGDAAKTNGENSLSKAGADGFETTVGGSVMSDYLYRGISLSKRDPSASGSVEVARGWFYASGQMYRVDLPGDPAAELTFTGGFRPTIWDVKFDLSAAYFYYPGESPPAGSPTTDYWQYGISAIAPDPRCVRDRGPGDICAELLEFRRVGRLRLRRIEGRPAEVQAGAAGRCDLVALRRTRIPGLRHHDPG